MVATVVLYFKMTYFSYLGIMPILNKRIIPSGLIKNEFIKFPLYIFINTSTFYFNK